MIKRQLTNKGFTLVEILVAMAVGSIVMAGVYTLYNTQVKFHIIQEEIVTMQQNIRAAVYYMGREIRLAGYDPTNEANAKIITATANEFIFTNDRNDDGDLGTAGTPFNWDANEYIHYAINTSNSLGRASGNGTLQPVAENIDALRFVYFNSSGAITATVSQIQSVQITIVARTGRRDINYTDTRSYTNPQGTVILPAQNDNYRRRVLTQTVKCRNLT